MRSKTLAAVLLVASLGIVTAACSSSGSSQPAKTTAARVAPVPITTATTPTAVRAANPLTAWCGLALGESKTEVLAAMGTAHGNAAATYMAKAGISGDFAEWDNVSGDILLASFTNGAASNLQAYAGSIGPTGASNITCQAFRH